MMTPATLVLLTSGSGLQLQWGRLLVLAVGTGPLGAKGGVGGWVGGVLEWAKELSRILCLSVFVRKTV